MRRLLTSVFLTILGGVLGWWWLRRYLQPPMPPQYTPQPPAPPAKTVPVQPALQKNDLTVINGVGPAFETALNDLDIYTFAQLAEQDPDDLAARMRARVTAERIRRDQWIEQAREKAGGA